MALTGRRGGPALGPPAPLVERIELVADALRRSSSRLGSEVSLDALALLGERAALAGLQRDGAVSCGGTTRLLRADGGWLAVSLARADDVALLPAWLEIELADRDPWAAVTDAVARRTPEELVARAVMLGLPVAALAERAAPVIPPDAPFFPLPLRATRVAPGPAPAAIDGLLVVDLSALWAGPLCASFVAATGATVVKVESVHRRDGARLGSAAFFHLLNADKQSVVLDLGGDRGRATLDRLLRRADVVVESSRPRALEQLGVDVHQHLGANATRVWVSITGHGRAGRGRNRVAFGDDAAVAGGLVAWEGEQPLFCADAIADPATGLVAAAACLAALESGGTWLLDVAMAEVAAHLAGPTLAVPGQLVAAPPHARPCV